MTHKITPVVVVNTQISVFTNLHQIVKNGPVEGMRNWEDGLLMGISYVEKFTPQFLNGLPIVAIRTKSSQGCEIGKDCLQVKCCLAVLKIISEIMSHHMQIGLAHKIGQQDLHTNVPIYSLIRIICRFVRIAQLLICCIP